VAAFTQLTLFGMEVLDLPRSKRKLTLERTQTLFPCSRCSYSNKLEINLKNHRRKKHGIYLSRQRTMQKSFDPWGHDTPLMLKSPHDTKLNPIQPIHFDNQIFENQIKDALFPLTAMVAVLAKDRRQRREAVQLLADMKDTKTYTCPICSFTSNRMYKYCNHLSQTNLHK